MEQHPYNRFFEELQPVLQSKVEEFKVLGFGSVKKGDLWEFLIKKKWKNRNSEDVHLYEIVADILSFNPSEFMNFITIEAYRSPNMLSDLDAGDLDALLNPSKPK